MHPTWSRKTPTNESTQRRGHRGHPPNYSVAVTPWDYVWKRYVKTPGESWGRTAEVAPLYPMVASLPVDLHGQPSLCTQPWRLCSGDPVEHFVQSPRVLLGGNVPGHDLCCSGGQRVSAGRYRRKPLQPGGNPFAFRASPGSVTGAFAEFERSLIRERQREGIALAKQCGAYKGRKKTHTPFIGQSHRARPARRKRYYESRPRPGLRDQQRDGLSISARCAAGLKLRWRGVAERSRVGSALLHGCTVALAVAVS